MGIRQQQYQQRNIAAGRCAVCSAPTEDGQRVCQAHSAAKDYGRNKRAQAKAQQIADDVKLRLTLGGSLNQICTVVAAEHNVSSITVRKYYNKSLEATE